MRTIPLTTTELDTLVRIALAMGWKYWKQELTTYEEIRDIYSDGNYPRFGIDPADPPKRFSFYNFNTSGDRSFAEAVGILSSPLVTVKLSDQYTAVLEGDEVVVGCQRFPKEKVKELYETFYEKK